jgi:hypothetical protein
MSFSKVSSARDALFAFRMSLPWLKVQQQTSLFKEKAGFRIRIRIRMDLH